MCQSYCNVAVKLDFGLKRKSIGGDPRSRSPQDEFTIEETEFRLEGKWILIVSEHSNHLIIRIGRGQIKTVGTHPGQIFRSHHAFVGGEGLHLELVRLRGHLQRLGNQAGC